MPLSECEIDDGLVASGDVRSLHASFYVSLYFVSISRGTLAPSCGSVWGLSRETTRINWVVSNHRTTCCVARWLQWTVALVNCVVRLLSEITYFPIVDPPSGGALKHSAYSRR